MGVDTAKRENLSEQVQHLEQEARMILPGIQSLFGFQLIAVFNQRFAEISPLEKRLHLLALLCSTLAILATILPAAYHRQTDPRVITEKLVRIGTLGLTWALFPLMVGTSVDVAIITRIVTGSTGEGTAVGIATLLAFSLGWFIYPRMNR